VSDVSTLDPAALEAFAGKMLAFLNGASAALMLSIGHRLGLFDHLADQPPATTAAIAAATDLDERYVREWLGAMTTAGVIRYEPESATYSLSPEAAAFTTRAAGPNNFAAVMQLVPVIAGVEDSVIDHFRHGGGVPYSEYRRFHEVMADNSTSVFDATLVDAVLPLVPGLVDRLEGGIDVADVGTGSGHAVNVMARAFPNSRFVGYDVSPEAIAVARAEAAAWQLDNAVFEVQDAARLDVLDRFELVTTFDAVHDQADPVAMIEGVHAALRPGGTWLCADIQASSELADNLDHPFGTFGYTVSCMHCMTVSLAYGGAGLGAMWGEQTARRMFADAGFTDIRVHVLEGDPMNNYYVSRKPG
jgi:SAM-dependent methyltransferase